MTRSDDDAAAALAASRLDAEARSLSGVEVVTLRHALAAAAAVLAGINPKGLPFARRRELELAREGLAAARPMLAWRPGPGLARTKDAASPSEGPAKR